MKDYIEYDEEWVNCRKDNPELQRKWNRLVKYLNEGKTLSERVEKYIEAGALVKPEETCIFTHRNASSSRMPNIHLNFDNDHFKISIRTLLYMGAFRRIALLRPIPACRNKHCVHPHHQHECYHDTGMSQPKEDMLIAQHRREVTWITDLVPVYVPAASAKDLLSPVTDILVVE